MRKSWLVTIGCGLLLLLIMAGCDEDECVSCPDPAVAPLGFTDGFLSLAPSATLDSCRVYGYGAAALNLDSVMVGDSVVPRSDWGVDFMPSPAGIHWVFDFTEDGVPSTFMYEHGDVATVRMWGEGRSGRCQLKILHPEAARATITSPGPLEDTIAAGGTDTVFWNTVEHADYYAITLGFLSPEGMVYIFDYAVDTSYVVAAETVSGPSNVLGIAVTPFTGPDPRSGTSNWTGDLLAGVIYSFGYYNETSIVIEHPLSPPPIGLSSSEAIRTELTPTEMIANVYKKYRQ